MKKIFREIVLFLGIAYVLCSCGVQHIENSATAEAEMADVVIGLIPAPTSDTEPAPTPSPEPTPAALPVSAVYMIEYDELMSATIKLPGTEGYEKYLEEDLCYHNVCKDTESGAEYWPFDICLPQFGENMPCYRELNAYFEELYAQLLFRKDEFYDEFAGDDSLLYYENYSYGGMTISEQYLTVYVSQMAYWGGIRDAINPMSVTFDLTTGKRITLPEIMNCSEEEVKELAADFVYEYFYSQGDEYAWRDKYLCYEPEQFYMLEQGLGVYYPRYAIECGAAGDFLFMLPYKELAEKMPGAALPEPQFSSTVTEIDCGEYESVINCLPGSEDYEAYLAEDMVYRDTHWTDENGSEQGAFDICLPRFKESLPCYEQINAYFFNWFADALDAKEEYYARLEREDQNENSYRKLYYEGMTIGERYLTVYTVWRSHDHGNLDEVNPVPVTFDLTTGKSVTLPEFLDCSEREAQELVADHVYRYLFNKSRECSWLECCLCYKPEQFYMLKQGLGVYYSQPALSSTGEGDALFIIPYEALPEEISGKVVS